MKRLKPLVLALFLSVSTVLAYAQDDYQQTSQSFSRAELDQMLAPIALYPDSVLTHILIAATYPLEVVKADRWSRSHSNIKPERALDAVEDEGWDPSVKALVSFPEILKRMSENLDWTQRVGDAFLDDEALVMDVIQGLRQRAYEAGSLNDMQYAKAYREDKVIIIEPSVERVVYVPYYDPQVVYGGWWWPNYPPVYWSSYSHPRRSYTSTRFYWGPRIYLGSSFFFSAFNWPSRHVVVVDSHRHRNSHTRVYTSRSVSRSHDAKHWQHNPKHRGSVSYRHRHVDKRYRPDRGDRSFRSDLKDRRDRKDRNSVIDRGDRTPKFRPHDRNKNPKQDHRSNTNKDRKYNSKTDSRKENSARDKRQRDDKNALRGDRNANKRVDREKRKFSSSQERPPKEAYRSDPPPQRYQQKEPKDIRWSNPAPPRQRSEPSKDREEEKSAPTRDEDDKKRKFRSQRGERDKVKRSAPVNSEPKTPRGTRFEPRPDRRMEKARSNRSQNQRGRDAHRKRDADSGR